MPVRARRKNRRLKKKKNKSRTINFAKPLFVLLAISVLVIYLLVSSKYWDGQNKLSIAIREEGGNVRVTTLDPQSSKITSVIIPGSTEVELARQLGRLQIKNVWQLGVNEKLDGKLLVETVTRNFKFPVFVWSEKNALGFADGNISSIVRATVFPYKTNLKVGDRIRMGIFSLGVNNKDRAVIDLTDTSYLKKTLLIDGEEGYKISGSFPQNLLIVFSDMEMSNQGTTVIIKDASGGDSTAISLGEVIEVWGAKVASIDSRSVSNTIFSNVDYDCLVGGRNEKAVEKISYLFSCNINPENIEGSFDLEIIIGSDFAERF